MKQVLNYIAERLEFYGRNYVEHRNGICNWLTNELIAARAVGALDGGNDPLDILEDADPYGFIPVCVAYLQGSERVDGGMYLDTVSGQTIRRQGYARAIANLIRCDSLKIVESRGPVVRGPLGEYDISGRVRP